MTSSNARPDGQFASTQWSLVLQARQRDSPEADQALAALCRAYWYPIYAYLRHKVKSVERAEDLTQEFFVRFLQKDFLAPIDRDKGNFRAYLLACCNHFLANQADRDHAQKRGGGRLIHSLDFPSAQQRYLHEPADTLTPERLYQRRWALTLLDAVLARLRQEFVDAGKEQLYAWLKAGLVGEPEALPYAKIGAALGLSEAAVKKAAQRLRQRYGEILREHIADTVDGPEAVEGEIRALFSAIGS